MKNYVYVISGDHGRQKIGVSDNPNRRLRELQTGSPYKLRFEFVGEAENGSADAIEVDAHFTLNPHKSPGGDEWFAVPPDVAITAVMASAHRLGYRLKPVDPDALAPPTYAVAGRPAWHKWVRIPPVIVGLFWLLPTLTSYSRNQIDGYHVIGAGIGTLVMVMIAQWVLIKVCDTFLAFDRAMHPEG